MTTTQDPSLPSPPFFIIPNINNLRDAALAPGGLITSTGEHVRSGLLFRSAEVSRLDTEGWKAVHGIGVSHVFDLRSKPEVDKGWKSVTGEKEDEVRTESEDAMKKVGVRRTWVPVFHEADYSPERLAERYMKYMGESVEGFVQAYYDILTHAGPAFRTILLHLANLSPQVEGDEITQGALIHCTAGKDRTGMFFGILLSFLGVEKERIAKEYQLTEQGLAHIRDDFVDRLMQSPGLKKYALAEMKGRPFDSEEVADALNKGGGDEHGEEVAIPSEVMEKGRQAALRMIGARKESMLAALEMVDKEWGSAEAFIRKECGISDVKLKVLRRALIIQK